MKTIILILSLFLSIQLFAQQEELMNLLPTGEQLKNFELKAEPEYYQGDDLFFLINGGADIYLEYGFKDVISASFSNETGQNFKAEIYRMLNDSATYGIFSFNSGKRVVTYNIGDACIIQNDFLIFIKGNYYTVLTSSSNKEEQQINLVGFAEVISDKIEASGLLPKLVAEHKDIALNPIYFLGNLALSNKYLFDHSDIFQFSDGLLIENNNIRAFIFNYRSPEACAEAFVQVKNKLQSSSRYTNFKDDKDSFTLADKKGNTLLFNKTEQNITVEIEAIHTDY